MIRLQGTGVFGGFAFGTIRILKKEKTGVVRTHVGDTDAEIARYREARDAAKEELKALFDKTLAETDDESARIFEVHRMLLDDPDFEDAVLNIISTERVNAEYAVRETGDSLAESFLSAENVYMQARAADMSDIADRVIRILQGGTLPDPLGDGEDVILLADDLSPSETVQLDKRRIRAFVTRYGSANSHTAILARALSIPSVIGLDFDEGLDGKRGIVDGYGSLLIVSPDEETVAEYEEKQKKDAARRERLTSLKGLDNVTLDGRRIAVYANIGGTNDAADAVNNDAGGIGLYRSEFLYLASRDYPSEEAQFQAYKSVAEKMGEKPVTIRTLDIGADKRVDYFQLLPEENPALGYRAIRICLDREELLRTQLRAILRAGCHGNISVMYPMIASVWEVRRLKEIFSEVRSDLEDEGIPHAKEMPQGIMIETPAAVLISGELAQEVDFFSIGTNDLTQYLLAADRQNPLLEQYSDPHHPAVLRAIRMAVESAHRHGIRVGICGELAADTLMTEFFLRLEVDELSVTPARVLDVRDAVRSLDLRE